MNKEKINELIKDIKLKLQEIENFLESDEELDQLRELGELDQLRELEELDQLKFLLDSDLWPQAVFEHQIANSEEDKIERASVIIDFLISEPLKDKKFLDFGCGEGHIVEYASKDAILSIGYDISKSWIDERIDLTIDFEEVASKGPYDIILINDVLDHSNDPLKILKLAKEVLHENGNIYLRCHPWVARHASHLYKVKNKAFMNLVFTDDELDQLGFKVENSVKIKYPIDEYNQLITEAGLKKKSSDVEYQTPEDFFMKNKLIADRIIKNFNPKDGKFPKFQMSQCFLDFVLNK